MHKIDRSNNTSGAKFWDSNPCGGAWRNYRDYLAWIRKTEPYIYSILDGYEWRGMRIVEVGCGQGSTLNFLPSLGAKVVGMDISFKSVSQAYAGAVELGQLASVNLLQSDAEMLPLSTSSFDLALSVGVLHHTEDTLCGIQEIHRILKPGGHAIVMLYRSGNPKWWLTLILRGLSQFIDEITGKSHFLSTSLRRKRIENSSSGTALLELFGVPILKAFTNRRTRSMFTNFKCIRITNHQPGFERLADVIPLLRTFTPILSWLDRSFREQWGFYQVIEATK